MGIPCCAFNLQSTDCVTIRVEVSRCGGGGDEEMYVHALLSGDVEAFRVCVAQCVEVDLQEDSA